MEPASFSLEQIQIASPCPAAWSEMEGDDRVRFCKKCQTHVYNLSAINRSEAESLVLKMERRLCTRLYRRADGTVLTQDCPVGARRAKEVMRGWLVLLTAAAALLFALAAGNVTNKKADMLSALRKVEPFATIINWLAPTPPPPSPPATGQWLVGSDDF